MTDSDLARETCELLGWEFQHIDEDGRIWSGQRTGGYVCDSWPDLAAAALAKVEHDGQWILWRVYGSDAGCRVELSWLDEVSEKQQGVAYGPASTTLFRAICMACVATRGETDG